MSITKTAMISYIFFFLFWITNVSAQNSTPQSFISVSGEAFASADTKESLIKITFEQNSPVLSQIDTFVDKEIHKLPKDKIKSISLTKKELVSANSANPEISKGAPLKAIYSYTLMVDTKNVMSVIDALFGQPSVKVQLVQSIPNSSSDSFKLAYAHSLENARLKAESIAKSSGMALGKILEVTSTEEVPPQVIREQLLQDPQALNSGSSEFKIFSTIKFELLHQTVKPAQ